MSDINFNDEDFYAKHFVYSYFIPDLDILFILNDDNSKWGDIRNDGSAILDNILDIDNERFSQAFFIGTFSTVFNKAKELYQNCTCKELLVSKAGTHPVYPYLNCDIYPYSHEETYSFIQEIRNCIKDEEIKKHWKQEGAKCQD